jgi:pheophorbide a oxygenase
LHQNWWPVTAVVSLDVTRPNALQVLGQKLVAVYNTGDEQWNVLDDRCSHRFAPLSEGRVLNDENGRTCVQCAYHGWEFKVDSGTCTKVPQQEQATGKSVQSYPVRRAGGMIWVWMDPVTQSLASEIQLPISPLLKEKIDRMGEGQCFSRDLPYGMEILGENLLDLAHLPFSHHSVAGLRRDFGGALPTRMLSQAERIRNAEWEGAAPVLPRYQAEIIDAAKHDPVFLGMPQFGNTSEWTTTIAFFDPCHVRYRRCRGPGQSSHVELFMCPTSEGQSRVFLYNIFSQPPVSPVVKPSMAQRFKVLKGSVEKRVFKPGAADGHLFTHQIFDGDGIFLNKQGNRMKDGGLSFRDYSTPSSADVLLNVYRRFLDAAARKTRDANLTSSAEAVVGMGQYGDDLERAVMLDRFNTHTKDCPTCSSALKQTRKNRSRVQRLQTAMQGAAGASTTAFVALGVMRIASVSLAPAVLPIVSVATIASWLASYASVQAEGKLDKRINQFLFEDYVHADKI